MLSTKTNSKVNHRLRQKPCVTRPKNLECFTTKIKNFYKEFKEYIAIRFVTKCICNVCSLNR